LGRKGFIKTFPISGVIKRCSWPDDPDRASRGGFVVGLTESGNPICRNPATTHVVPLLPHILSLLRVMNELWQRDSIAMVSEPFKSTYTMLESERKNLLGVSPVFADPMDPVEKQPMNAVERMQQFLFTIYENSYHLMGAAGPSMGRDLYALPGIADALISSAFSGLENVPDFRLRPIIRVFFKSFIYSCPPAFYESVLLPVFAHVGPFSKYTLYRVDRFLIVLESPKNGRKPIFLHRLLLHFRKILLDLKFSVTKYTANIFKFKFDSSE
jgi:exportin-5